MSHTLHLPFQNSLLWALGRPDFCLKRFPQSQGKAPWGRGCYRMSHKLQSPFRNSLLWALGRPEFCYQSFYYTIRNSLMLISSKYTSFGGNCNKISFPNLPALKTPVNRHPIGCHTRCTRHSKILYFAPSEDQIFA